MFLFVVTTLPLQINNVLFAVSTDTKMAQDMLPYSWLLAFLGPCLEPVMYATLWPSYKDEFIKVRNTNKARYQHLTTQIKKLSIL